MNQATTKLKGIDEPRQNKQTISLLKKYTPLWLQDVALNVPCLCACNQKSYFKNI